jgi:indoleamine 2,3-dioxygenase
MWKKSKPNDYTSFRTFIFGITSQSMFPNGVVYEGVSEKPMSFRGESGANDSIVPLCDNILQIPMPATPLTKILEDFRQYRPGNHREFLAWVSSKANSIGTREYAMKDVESATLFLELADQVREFRWRHWCFTREYILKKTTHPTATGGSPIVKWLPNQLFAVLKMEGEIVKCVEEMGTVGKVVAGIREVVERQTETLEKEVKKFCEERGVAAE